METKDGSGSRFSVVPLFERPDLITDCVRLLNSQWPRSETARKRTLEQCRAESLPTSLLLILQEDSSTKVVGHSKISPVPSRPTECFVESVVIDSTMRGQGLGRLIMDGTEQFVKRKGITKVHLTTHDQQGFYSKLGYEFSEPIVVYGGVSPKLQQVISSHACPLLVNNAKSDTHVSGAKVDEAASNPSEAIQGPPLPPPPPPPPMLKPTSNQMDAIKVSMSKSL